MSRTRRVLGPGDDDMEIRKVQITGGSSFIVSLPKEWVRDSNIKKNDAVGLIVQPDGSLTITPRITGQAAERVKNIDLKNIEDPEHLYRLLIGAYVTGFNTIRMTSPTRIPAFAHKAVRMFIQASIGQEVSEQTDRLIVIKDLLNPGEMPFDNVISRMQVIIQEMLRDSVFALRSRDRELAEDVISRDRDVNRLYWLISRQYNLLLRNVSLSREMGTNVEMALHYLQIARVMERTGDQVVKIAENVLTLMFISMERKMLDIIQSLSVEAMDIFETSVRSFFNRDPKMTNDTLERVKKFSERCNQASHELFDVERPGIVHVGYIVENLKRVGEYSGVICETSINYYVMMRE
jgi:phosphate uptake regulator